MRPTARSNGVLVETIGGEMVVYDTARDQAHGLNELAAAVWRHCDGVRDVSAIAAAATGALGRAVDQDLVRQTLHRLSEASLLEAPVAGAPPGRRVTRRGFAQRVAQAGAATLLLPIVTSVAAPTVADAQSSPTCSAAIDVPAPCDG